MVTAPVVRGEEHLARGLMSAKGGESPRRSAAAEEGERESAATWS
ncbi:MAG: hypothetical protein R3E96_06535 [Planctomycetota bacterium]